MRYLFFVLVFLPLSSFSKDFSSFPRTSTVVEVLVTEHGLDRALVEKWMSSGVYRQASVSNLAAPAEKTKTYKEYKPMFVAADTIRRGKKFYEENIDLLKQAENKYGVPAEVIVSIIGIESRYGRSKGRHRTFDSLGSLAVTEGRRADYFQREWIKFIVITHGLGMEPLKMKGSYAGATGYPQFMPTSYEAYAVDHDGDGDIDIWSDANDAIGSVANYLKQNGWKAGQDIISTASISDAGEQIKFNSFERDRKLTDVANANWKVDKIMETEWYVFPIRLDTEDGPKYWLGYRNFWSISRYNRSIAYSMAVVQLAEALVDPS
jgi:membrane-bound lytic murein transglycosylase B